MSGVWVMEKKLNRKPVVALLGTLDTKGIEYRYIRERLQEQGVDSLLIDAGIIGKPQIEPEITHEQVAEAAGTSLGQLLQANDRGLAVETMAKGAASLLQQLYTENRIDGVLGLGGSGGTSLITHAMQALPIGVPKMMVSTMASGDTRPYVGAVDIAMMYSVVDIAGINKVSAQILSNAAGAIAGMVKAVVPEMTEEKPLLGATMFGVTTPAVDVARKKLEQLGYEILVFHATGTGGQSMEALVKNGYLKGVLDLTTTELVDDLVGGVLSAGPNRLEVAGQLGIPQVVSLGALDMANFGSLESVPLPYKNRLLCVHNSTVTLMRTTPEECAELGKRIARKLNQAKGPVSLFIPLKGTSVIATEGQIFYNPVADQALFQAIHEHIDPQVVNIVEWDTDINDPAFALAMAEHLHEMYQVWLNKPGTTTK